MYTCVYTYVQTQQIVHIKYIQFLYSNSISIKLLKISFNLVSKLQGFFLHTSLLPPHKAAFGKTSQILSHFAQDPQVVPSQAWNEIPSPHHGPGEPT